MTKKDLDRTISLLHRVAGHLEGRNNEDARHLGMALECSVVLHNDVLMGIGRLEKIKEDIDAND